jgi:hypothetical protein
MKWPGCLLVTCLLLPLWAAAVTVVPDLPLPLGIRELPLIPTKGPGFSPGLVRVGEGRVVAAWFERAPGSPTILHVAEFEASRGSWSESSVREVPAAPAPGAEAECSVFSPAEGRAEFRWHNPLAPMTRVLVCRVSAGAGRPGSDIASDTPDSLAAGFPDGTRLLVSRELLPDGGTGLVQRRSPPGSAEAERSPVVGDHWDAWVSACGGLRLAHLAPRVSLAWHGALDGDEAVFLAQSPDAGLRWQLPLRVDLGHPLGEPDLVLAQDASALLCWREGPGDDASQPAGLYFRRYASNGATTLPTLVATERLGVASGAPRLALLQDSPASPPLALILVPGAQGLRTLLLTLPSRAELVEADRSCQCAEEPGAGFQLRAEVLGADPKSRQLVVSHGGIPGLAPAESGRLLTLAPGIALPPVGRRCLFRIEVSGEAWRALSLRELGDPVAPHASH